MITFETTAAKLEKFTGKHQANGGQNQSGSVELFEANNSGGHDISAKRKGLSNASVAALAVGGTILVVRLPTPLSATETGTTLVGRVTQRGTQSFPS